MFVDRPSQLSTAPCRLAPHGCQQVFLENRVLCRLAQYVDRPIGMLTVFGHCAVFKLDSEFVADLNLEFLVFFNSMGSVAYKEGYYPLMIVFFTYLI